MFRGGDLVDLEGFLDEFAECLFVLVDRRPVLVNDLYFHKKVVIFGEVLFFEKVV